MTNLEFYKDEIKNEYILQLFVADALFSVANKHGYVESKNFNIIDWLCEEHKEPIKLKQWEYDLLSMYNFQRESFRSFNDISTMKRKGHFKGVTDTSMKIYEILDNCEIVADDYSDFDEECK